MRPSGVAQFPAVLALLVALSGCTTGDRALPGTGFGTVLDSDGRLHFRGVVQDRATKAPLAGAVLAIELGGVYRKFPDTAHGSPYYAFGGVTDASGRFDLALPPGRAGVHAFSNGHVCGGRFSLEDLTEDVTIEQSPLSADVLATRPAIDAFTATLEEGPGGPTLLLDAQVHAGTGKTADPLSDEIVVVEPKTAWGGELDPPTRGDLARGYPDGHYQRTIARPTAPGDYTYYAVAMSEGCITSDITSAVVSIR